MKNIGTKVLDTDRLILRKIKKSDALEAYNNWCSNEAVSKYVVWSKHENVEETEKLFDMWEKEYEDLTTYRWIAELKDTHELIGTIDVVSKKHLKYGVCEIGYCYGEKFWGLGYATEALKAVIKFLFEESEADVIFADYMSNNPASGVVMEKAGMKFDGVLRGRIIDKDGLRNDLGSYSVIKEEYLEIKEIRKIVYKLAEKMRSEKLSKHKVKKLLKDKYPNITSNSIDILIGDALFSTR